MSRQRLIFNLWIFLFAISLVITCAYIFISRSDPLCAYYQAALEWSLKEHKNCSSYTFYDDHGYVYSISNCKMSTNGSGLLVLDEIHLLEDSFYIAPPFQEVKSIDEAFEIFKSIPDIMKIKSESHNG